MKDLELVHYKLGENDYEIRYYEMKSTDNIYFLLDDIFEVIKYENEDRNKEYRDLLETLINIKNKKGVIYLKDVFGWVDDEGALVVDRSLSETLTPFVSLLTLLNISDEDIDSYVNPTRFVLLKKFLEEKFKKLKRFLEEKFRKEKMIEELLEVPKDLNEVLPPIENYRPLDKTSDELIKERDKAVELMEKDEEPKYIVPNPDYVRQSMEACFEENGGGIKQLMEKWGNAEELYGKDSYIVALRDRFRSVYGMIPSEEKESDKQ